MPKRNNRISLVLAFAAVLALAGALAAFAAERVTPTASGSPQSPPRAAAMPNVPENAEELQGAQGQPPVAPALTRLPATKLTPMMAELLGYLDVRDKAMAEKKQALAAAKSDPAAALALQADLQRMKQETELEMLRIQLRWAQKEGRTTDADRLSAVLDEILHPRVPVNTETRPAPTTSR